MAFITAQTGKNVKALINLSQSLFKQSQKRVSTGTLNRIVREAVEAHPPASRENRTPRIYYATQVGVAPPRSCCSSTAPSYSMPHISAICSISSAKNCRSATSRSSSTCVRRKQTEPGERLRRGLAKHDDVIARSEAPRALPSRPPARASDCKVLNRERRVHLELIGTALPQPRGQRAALGAADRLNDALIIAVSLVECSAEVEVERLEDRGHRRGRGAGIARMIVGVPKEIKSDEYRVAMLPVGAEELSQAGHTVLIEAGAGQGSGIADAQYQAAGATIVTEAAQIWAEAELVVKVKEPQPSEWPLLRPAQVLFTYFHFAADLALTRAVIDSGITAIAYETLRDQRGGLPLLTPMSEVAGRMSIQEGAKYLERPQEGRGILLSGVPGVAPAEVAILGGGVVGSNAAKVAAGLGANVRILDINLDRLRYLDDIMPPNVTTLYSDRHTIVESIERADLVIGAILITGARAPRLLEARGPQPA